MARNTTVADAVSNEKETQVAIKRRRDSEEDIRATERKMYATERGGAEEGGRARRGRCSPQIETL